MLFALFIYNNDLNKFNTEFALAKAETVYKFQSEYNNLLFVNSSKEVVSSSQKSLVSVNTQYNAHLQNEYFMTTLTSVNNIIFNASRIIKISTENDKKIRFF